jgi:hypothetical protein
MTTRPLAVVVLDVGSVRPRQGVPRLGWCGLRPDSGAEAFGDSLQTLVEHLVDEIRVGRKVALGFECPLWMPLPTAEGELGRGRAGIDGARASGASAGSQVLATGLQECAWVLVELAQRLPTRPQITFVWTDLVDDRADLLLFEAFVTQGAKAPEPEAHIADARSAAVAFVDEVASADHQPTAVLGASFNLGAACALRAGLTTDVDLLTAPCLVVKVKPLPATA